METTQTKKSMKNFMIMWVGQFFSMLGSGISAFGLSLWVLQKNTDVTSFAMTVLFAVLPGVLLSPLAGSLADRKNRKAIIVITDSLDALSKLVILFILLSGRLDMWMIYLLNFVSSTLSTFQGPSFEASIPQIVPKDQLTKANSLLQLNGAIRAMLVPIIATALYGWIGLKGLFILDFLSYGFAILTILIIPIPQTYAKEHETKGLTFWQDLIYAFRYILDRKGLLTLMLIVSLLNGIANLAMTLLGPLVKAGNDLAFYGWLSAAGGISLILGGVFSSFLKETSHKIVRILTVLIISGVGLALMGLSPSWWLIALGQLIFVLPIPYVNALFGSLIQSKIESSTLGRVVALLGAISMATTPLAVAVAGPLADKVFLPLLNEGGGLANSIIAALVGVGPGRGIGLMFLICGLLLVLLMILALMSSTIRNMETALPDVLEE